MYRNKLRQDILSFAMFKNKVTKTQLKNILKKSYPTIFSRLENTGNITLDEAILLCDHLKIDINEFTKPNIINYAEKQ